MLLENKTNFLNVQIKVAKFFHCMFWKETASLCQIIQDGNCDHMLLADQLT